MTQDERWYTQWKEIMDFMDANKRRPSKFMDEERGMRNWWKLQQKLMNAITTAVGVFKLKDCVSV